MRQSRSFTLIPCAESSVTGGLVMVRLPRPRLSFPPLSASLRVAGMTKNRGFSPSSRPHPESCALSCRLHDGIRSCPSDQTPSCDGVTRMAGFSLIELAIVLVILGLLVGGIMSGQSLIRAAELRSVTRELQGYQAAVGTFRDKYLALPGDMRNATAFWGRQVSAAHCVTNSSAAVSAPGSCDGDGNGTLSDATAINLSSESFQFWRQLQHAGLIEGTYTGMNGAASAGFDGNIGINVPRSKLGNAGWQTRYIGPITASGNLYYYVANYGHVFYFGTETPTAETMFSALKPEEAWSIDTKVDDGIANSGKVLSQPHTTSYTPNCTSAATSDNYNLTNTSIACALTIITGW